MKKANLTKVFYLVSVMLAACQTSVPSSWSNAQFNPDDAITTSIRAVFSASNNLAGIPIEVETNHGIVQLRGYVRTIRQSDEAEQFASQVGGVKQVDNRLIVRK